MGQMSQPTVSKHWKK